MIMFIIFLVVTINIIVIINIIALIQSSLFYSIIIILLLLFWASHYRQYLNLSCFCCFSEERVLAFYQKSAGLTSLKAILRCGINTFPAGCAVIPDNLPCSKFFSVTNVT